MGATATKARADLRRRKLQGGVIGLVLFLATGAATLALSILVESQAPFDRAFTAANGAHLVIEYAGAITPDRLAATAGAAGVSASAGPWPVVRGGMSFPKGGQILGQVFSGRPAPSAAIDAATIEAGRWWRAPGEVVLDQDMAALLEKGVGDTVSVYPDPRETGNPPGDPAAPAGSLPRTLTVVGIAGSVSTPDVSAWMSPSDIAALSPGGPPDQQMLYRVEPSATEAELTAATASITEGLPADAVRSSTTYLGVKSGVDRLADLYVPVLLAFSVFALLAAAFTIANVVSGIVLTSYREIGVMKAIGFTPGQVTAILVAQMVVPVVIGSLGGVIVGTIASAPIVAKTAMSFGLPSAFTLSATVIAAVLVVAVVTAVLAAIGPALRAGRISAVAAMSRGSAPSGRPDGGRLRRLGLRLPLPLPIRLGVSAGVAHPVRATMTLGALVVGVAAATFALGLNWSLLRVMDDLHRDHASPVRVELPGSRGGSFSAKPGPAGQPGPTLSGTEISAAIAVDRDIARFVAIGRTTVSVPALGTVPFMGYDRESSWLGYALIHGRWFATPGEVVVPTAFLAATGLQVGDSVTLAREGHVVAARIVGEVFDTPAEDQRNVAVRGTFADLATLQPGVQPAAWELGPADRVEVRALATALRESIGSSVDVSVVGDSSNDTSFLVFLSVIGALGAVLVAISLGGVFNTVLLETRQRTRELAVLKAIGVTPVQVIGLVVASIVPIGLLAGLIGVPLGIGAQHAVLTYMGQVAAKTAIPDSVFDVFAPAVFVGLGLAGLAIGVVGAYLPAQRAARLPIAPVLQAE